LFECKPYKYIISGTDEYDDISSYTIEDMIALLFENKIFIQKLD
jgi:hypothetical protein